MKTKLLKLLVVMTISITALLVLGITASAETVGAFEVTGGTSGEDYTYADSVLTINNSEKPASAVVTAPTPIELAYNESAQELINAGTATGGEMQYSLEENGEYSTTIPTGTNAGTYIVWYKVVGDENHSDTEPESVEAAIAKVTPQFVYTKKTPTYTGEAQKLVAINLLSYGCTVKFSFDRVNWSSDIPTGTNAGDYKIYYIITGSVNYSDYSGNNFYVSIAKAIPEEPAVPTATAISYGEKLSASTLSDGWSWVDGTIVPNADANYDAYIVVDDSNYDYIGVEGYDSTNHRVVKAVEVTVNMATPTLVVTATPATATAGATVSVSVTASNPYNAELNDVPTPVLTYKIGENGAETAFTGSFVIPKDTVSGTTITIKAEIAGNTLYTTNSDTTTVLVTDCTHSGTTELKWNETAHWYDCSNCGSKDIDKAAHSGGTATCVAAAVCETCREAHGVIDSNNHANKSTAWTNDATGHWHVCDCGNLDFAPHTSSGAATPNKAETCTLCGYEIAPATGYVSSPTFTPASGTTFTSTQNVIIACATEGATIYYTTDGSTPTTASTKYTGAITITSTTTIKAIAVKDGMGDSTVSSVTYTKQGSGGYIPTPTPTPIPTPTPTPTTPVDNEPQIKGDNGKTGWNVIKDEIKDADAGDTIVIDMNGITKLPKDITSEIKGKDIDIVLDMGNGITWTINGLDVTKPKAVDMRVSKTAKRIPVEVINNVTGGKTAIQLSLTHDGDFGFTAVLNVDLGKKNNGFIANLFWYNEKTEELEHVDYDEIQNGKANLIFTHASEWAIVIDEEALGEVDDVSSAAGITNNAETLPDNSEPIVVTISLAGLALAATLVMKKKKTE